MELTPPDTSRTTWTRRARRPAALMVLVALASAACGGSSTPTAVVTTSIVRPPDLPLQGCNYVVNGAVPAGMSQGIQPPFASIRPDQAAVAALRHIERHGGTAIVDGFNVPTGTGLYAGPDSSVPPAITLPSTASVLIAEPVLWTTNSGQHWLATFLACGGPNLYWIDVDKVAAADKAAGSLMTSTIARALASQNSMSGVSSQHITISASGQFAWTSAQLPFTIARGQVQAT